MALTCALHRPIDTLSTRRHALLEERGFACHSVDLTESQFLWSSSTFDFDSLVSDISKRSHHTRPPRDEHAGLVSDISKRSHHTRQPRDEHAGITEFNRQCFLFSVQLEALRTEPRLAPIHGSLRRRSSTRDIRDDKPSCTTREKKSDFILHEKPLSLRGFRDKLRPPRPRLTSPLSPNPPNTLIPGPPRRPMPLKRCKTTPMLATALHNAHQAVRERGRSRFPVDIGNQIQSPDVDDGQHSQGENWLKKSWIIVAEDDWVVVDPGTD